MSKFFGITLLFLLTFSLVMMTGCDTTKVAVVESQSNNEYYYSIVSYTSGKSTLYTYKLLLGTRDERNAKRYSFTTQGEAKSLEEAQTAIDNALLRHKQMQQK